MVDKDRVRGSAEQAKGNVKEVIGKVTGDRKLASEGKAGQLKGKVQNAAGGLNEAANCRGECSLCMHCQLRPLRVAKLVIIVVQTSLRFGV